MNEGLMKMAEGYEMIAAGIRQMVSEGRNVPEAAEKAPEKSSTGRGGGNAVPYIKEVFILERWKDIEGMEGKYQISDQGRIRCMPRYVKCRGGYVRWLPMKVLELKYDEVLQIKRMLAGGVHPYEIAEKMGISRKMVSKIKSGRSYAWLD